jgi:hypothetical protein
LTHLWLKEYYRNLEGLVKIPSPYRNLSDLVYGFNSVPEEYSPDTHVAVAETQMRLITELYRYGIEPDFLIEPLSRTLPLYKGLAPMLSKDFEGAGDRLRQLCYYLAELCFVPLPSTTLAEDLAEALNPARLVAAWKRCTQGFDLQRPLELLFYPLAFSWDLCLRHDSLAPLPIFRAKAAPEAPKVEAEASFTVVNGNLV